MTRQCIAPPQLDDLALLMALDGEAEQPVLEHLRRCPACAARAARLERAQGRLSQAFSRVECPQPGQLGEHQLGLLSAEQSRAVERHMAGCPHCRRELAQLSGYLSELAPEIELTRRERVKILIARLLPAPGFGQPLALGLRGAEEGPLVYEAGDLQVVLELQDDAEGPDYKTLLGLLTGVEPDNLQAYLWHSGELLTSVPVDELGNFVIPGLAPNGYDLILSGPELEVHIQTLRV